MRVNIIHRKRKYVFGTKQFPTAYFPDIGAMIRYRISDSIDFFQWNGPMMFKYTKAKHRLMFLNRLKKRRKCN